MHARSPVAFHVRLLAAAWLALAAVCSPARADGVSEIGLVHVNDIYQIAPVDPQAPRGGLARLATLVRSIRGESPATLFVFGGDTLSPSIESTLLQGRQMIAAWNALQLDFAVPGNHEFDLGDEVLRARLAESRFTWLAANLHAEPPLPQLRPSAIRVLGGVRVGLVGLITPEVTAMSSPGPGLRFEDLLAAAGREAAALRRDGAEVVVALTHCSLDEDRLLAASGLFDLILGGHEHQLITELAGRTPIFKAGSDARDAIRVRLRVESGAAGHRLLGLSWEIVPVDGRWPEDAAVKAIGEDSGRLVDAQLDLPLAENALPLDVRAASVRRGESAIGNFAADAVREAVAADIALLNAGSLRSDRILAPGPLTRRDLLALLPFQNRLLVLAITGAQLRGVLEHGIGERLAKGQSGAWPLVSGLRLAYDPGRPAGRRIVRLEIGGGPADPAKTYRLATSSYLAGGGDGYPFLKELPVVRPAEASPTDTAVVGEAMAKAGRIAPVVDGRLQALP